MLKIEVEKFKYSYYITEKGKVYKNKKTLLSTWIHPSAKIPYVSLVKECGKRFEVSVAKLLLSTFKGGFIKSRRVNYVDGDCLNVKLSNLEWKSGFANGVDYDYLNELDSESLGEIDLHIKNYLLTDNILHINKIIKYVDNLYFFLFKRYGVLNEYKDFISYFKEALITKTKNGWIKPHRDKKILEVYFKKWAKGYILKALRKKLNKNEIQILENTIEYNLYYEDKDFENIEDEIQDMFDFYS